MQVETAVQLINGLIFHPGWEFEPLDHTCRYEGAIKVRVHYPAENTNRDKAAEGYLEQIRTYADFVVIVEDCADDLQLYRKLLRCADRIHNHEDREALRTKLTNWSPFHPHKVDGMKRWKDTACVCLSDDEIQADMQFGAV